MTANPFAALLDGVRRYECKPTPLDRHANMVLETDVLAALAAAVSADLAEAGKVVEGVTPSKAPNVWRVQKRYSFICHKDTWQVLWDVPKSTSVCLVADTGGDTYSDERDARFIAWCREGVPALLARLAAQEAQIKWLEAEITATDDLMAADSCRIAALETALAAEREKVARLVEAWPPFFFDRYINGVRMAEDVCVERETTLEGAMRVAARIAAKGPNGEPPVLVYRSTETAALAAITEASQ